MDGYPLPDRNQFLQFLKKLKEVFDVCDEHADGFIRVQRFVDLGLRFGQGDEVQTLTTFLDPKAQGKINFKDFCHGVFAIKGCEDVFEAAVGPYFVPEVQPSFTDNGHIYQNGERRRAPEDTVCTRPHQDRGPYQDQDRGPYQDQGRGPYQDQGRGPYQDQGRGPYQDQGRGPYQDQDRGPYQDQGRGPYQDPGDEDMMDSSAEHTDGADAQSDTGLGVSSSPASAILGEEQFEDYGEGVDLSPSSPGTQETHNTGFSDRGTSSAGRSPQKTRLLDNSELLDVFCSQCCKKVNVLNDLQARLRDLKASSPNRKTSSRAFGRQLFHSNQGVFCGGPEDLLAGSMEPCDITQKVIFLEQKVTELESDSVANGDLKSRLKQENTQLVHRVHELEEQVKDAEVRAEQSLEEELRRHKEAHSRTQQEQSAEMELLSNKVQQLEENSEAMTLTVCRLKSQSEKLDQEKRKVTEQLEDSRLRLKDEMDLYREVLDQLWLLRHQFHKEKEAMQEVTEDLRRQLERLQLFRLEVERPGEGWGRAHARAREVQQEVQRLQQENHKLRDQNDDLNAQILSLSLYEAKNLLASHTKAQCLAAEIQTATRDELVDAVKEQEENNYRLRQYMDKIILAILDHNPSILEIKNE